MRNVLISSLLIAAVASLGACGPKDEPAKKPSVPSGELETITLTIEGMS